MAGKWKGLIQNLKRNIYILYLAAVTRKPHGMLSPFTIDLNTVKKKGAAGYVRVPLQHHFGNAYFFNNRFIADRS